MKCRIIHAINVHTCEMYKLHGQQKVKICDITKEKRADTRHISHKGGEDSELRDSHLQTTVLPSQEGP